MRSFYSVKTKKTKGGIEIYPEFKIRGTKDLLVKGGQFYGVWNEKTKLWSTVREDVVDLIDEKIWNKFEEIKKANPDDIIIVKTMDNYTNKTYEEFIKYCKAKGDTKIDLDCKVKFKNDSTLIDDYVSKKLDYDLCEGDISSYDKIMSTLYNDSERMKLEWAIGSVIAGDSVNIQKFIVIQGAPGKGKSTILNIITSMFGHYVTNVDVNLLTSKSAFSGEGIGDGGLIGIQHEGDLSRVTDNTMFNSIVSHEPVEINKKHKSVYTQVFKTFLFIGSNSSVRITDKNSGLLRRLILVNPTGNLLPVKEYEQLMSKIYNERGAIAYHCLQVYKSLGSKAYNDYTPTEMLYETNDMFNFIDSCYYEFERDDGVTRKQAWEKYKKYCEEADVRYPLNLREFGKELKDYFDKFEREGMVDNKHVRNYYSEFKVEIFNYNTYKPKTKEKYEIKLDSTKSILDDLWEDCKAQYTVKHNVTNREIPFEKWEECNTTLKNILTDKVHYVKPPPNHIVIDFDLKDGSEKSLERNLEAAREWPSTYTEISKGGSGIHLHYLYEGDVSLLCNKYAPDIEIKTFVGGAALRRRLTKCNNLEIAVINKDKLKLKEEKMIDFDVVTTEKSIRTMIHNNLSKLYHPGTKPSIDFIWKILDDAYKNEDLIYDVTDLRPSVLAFASSSTNNATYCIKLVNKMQFKSAGAERENKNEASGELNFLDIEVYPNLFVIAWSYLNEDKYHALINPSANDVEELINTKIVGFNCRKYDNHILYAALMGYNNAQLFDLSQKIISGNSKNCFFSEAYNLSYTDVYCFLSAGNKMSLKKWEIKLGIRHLEMHLPWDQDVPEELWPKVAEYCGNDVMATKATFLANQSDWNARLMLSALSGLSPNDTTNQHAARILFGDDPNPQSKFIYTDLSKEFDGYTFINGKSMYRGIEVGEGGYVYAEPGIYKDVDLLDVESMHPTSLIQMNYFGPYTQRFKELKDARLSIKHGRLDEAKNMLGGILAPYLNADGSSLKGISDALKTVINAVYGMSSAKFDNKFKHPDNVDNIIAKRGALFMIDLMFAVQEKCYTVAHIKTDSIKIPNGDDTIRQFVSEFGKKYGYNFEYENRYEKFCLVNNAVYIAKDKKGWNATGAQFQHPYVFKKLFSKEDIVFDDYCETKSVLNSAMYLDKNEDMGEDEHNYIFVGRVGSFVPVSDFNGGGILLRKKDDKYHAVTGTKGYRWKESEEVRNEPWDFTPIIDLRYFDRLVDEAVKTIDKFELRGRHGDIAPWEDGYECKGYEGFMKL